MGISADKPGFVTAGMSVELVGRRSWRLSRPLIYRAGSGELFTAPNGFVTDFASEPWPFRGVLARRTRTARSAALHDWLIAARLVPRRRADRIFHEALLHEGLGRGVAAVFYLAVRLGSLWAAGRRWLMSDV